MLKSRKHVFWEALIITIVIFLAGILLGVLIETSNSNKINNLYTLSEISLNDAVAASTLSKTLNLDCSSIKENNIEFANKIYEEAKLLEKYEESGKITDNMKILHRKYDLLRTLIWMNNQEALEKCNNYELVVYLYEYETQDTVKKATQNVWSKILLEAKTQNDNILLLPIAADQNLTSLNLLIDKYEVKQFPAVIINNKEVLYSLENSQTINENIASTNTLLIN